MDRNAFSRPANLTEVHLHAADSVLHHLQRGNVSIISFAMWQILLRCQCHSSDAITYACVSTSIACTLHSVSEWSASTLYAGAVTVQEELSILPHQLLRLHPADDGGVHGDEPQQPGGAGAPGRAVVLPLHRAPGRHHHWRPRLQVLHRALCLHQGAPNASLMRGRQRDHCAALDACNHMSVCTAARGNSWSPWQSCQWWSSSSSPGGIALVEHVQETPSLRHC